MEDRVRILETQLGLAHPQVVCAASADLLDWMALGSCTAAEELMPAAGCPWARCLFAASHIDCHCCLSGGQGMAGAQPGVSGTA